MSYSHPRDLERFALQVRESMYRGLVMLHSSDIQGTLHDLTPIVRRKCIAVLPQPLRPPKGCRVGSPAGFEKLLGLGADYVVIATNGLLRPNLIAGLAGIVSAGGLLIIVAPPLESWNPGPSKGWGGYRKYLIDSVREAPILLWADASEGVLYALKPPKTKAGEWRLGPGSYESKFGVPDSLLAQTVTRDQAEALDRFKLFLDAGYRSFLVTGDRGRGKSYLLGLAVAMAAWKGVAGEAVAVAPSPLSLESFFKGLQRGLRSLHMKYRVKRAGDGSIVAVTGPWGRVAYSPPDEAKPSGLFVVDEAASIGVARLRRLAWKSGRVVVASTVHGYEGSGRVFQHMVEDVLPKPIERVELDTPIRYPPNDPLEQWVNNVFVLKPEPDYEPPRKPRSCLVSKVERDKLASSPSMVRRIMQLLALAHYRTEPDYLLVLLESTNHKLLVLECDSTVVAVADLAVEEWGMEEPARLALKTLWLQVGDEASRAKAVRVVRIAVHPALQRRGLGSLLLRKAEEYALNIGADFVAALFGRHDVIGFWLKNGYILFYVSPRYNKFTGEKNVGFAKPITPLGEKLVAEASRRVRRKLVFGAHSVYRDVAAEKIAILLTATKPVARANIRVEEAEIVELKKYLTGLVDLEQVVDSAYILTAASLLRGCENSLGTRGLTAVVARILQGKPLGEVAEILGASIEDASKEIRKALEALVKCAIGGSCRLG